MEWKEIVLTVLQVIGGVTVIASVVLACVYAWLRNAPFEPDDSEQQIYDYQ